MKRDEMVQVIVDCINRNKYNGMSPSTRSLADLILNSVEENGMLPPEVPDDSMHPESNFVCAWEE